MRTHAITIALAAVIAAPAIAGAINLNPDALSVRLQAGQPGVSAQYSRNNTPEINGDLNHLDFRGALSVQSATPTPEGFNTLFTMSALAAFATDAHNYAVEFASFDLDARVISALAPNHSMIYTITAGVFAGGPAAAQNPLDHLVFGIASFSNILDGPAIDDLDHQITRSADENEAPLAILPSFSQLAFGFVIEFAGGVADTGGSFNATIEFGGDTGFQGLNAGLQLTQLPAPGAVSLFGLAALASARRRR